MADTIKKQGKIVEKAVAKTNRSRPKYSVNPSYERALENTYSGDKKLIIKQNDAGEKMYLVKGENGTRMPVGLHTIKRVDKTQFAKLYVNGMKAFCKLSPCGAALFEVIYNFVLDHKETDQIALHYSTITDDWDVSERTFQRALGELLEKEFIFYSTIPHIYWINIDYIFNGDRFSMIQTYVREDSAWEEPMLPLDLLPGGGEE